eukprot:GHVL01012729.1.p1 GENE.GHVL01012729.1~~GHVL01012729.1.p1  ORF type:complete len:465 (+),score=59.53 GHVL01012729.1:607-2001(+)
MYCNRFSPEICRRLLSMENALKETCLIWSQKRNDSMKRNAEEMETAQTYLEPPTFHEFGKSFQSNGAWCGRICPSEDTNTEVLNRNCICIEGISRTSGSKRLELKLPLNDAIAMFPGQIVGVIGNTATPGASRIVQMNAFKIFHGASCEPPKCSVQDLDRAVDMYQSSAAVHISVSAGPFFFSENFDTCFLDVLVNRLVLVKPHIIILIGPLISASNKMLNTCDLESNGEDLTFLDLYSKLVAKSINTLCESCKDSKVVVLPSLDDVGHLFPIPQPAMPESLLYPCGNPPANLIFLSNPGVLTVNDIKIFLTSTDMIDIIERCLFTENLPENHTKTDMVSNLILKQRHPFPVDPPPPGFIVEPTKFECLEFDPKSFPEIFISTSSKSIPQIVTQGLNDGRLFIQVPSLARQLQLNPKRPAFCIDMFINPPNQQKNKNSGALGDNWRTKDVPSRVRVDLVGAAES